MTDFLGEQSRCAVIGYGSWGTAIAKILLERGTDIGWYIKNDVVRESVVEHRVNPKYLSEVHFPKDKQIRVYDDINKAVEDNDILIFAVPSAFLKDLMGNLQVSLDGKMILSAIKGIVTDTQGNYITITEYFNQIWGVEYDRLGIITGPCHAEEVALERLTYLNIVCKYIEVADMLKKRFECNYMIINTLTDIYGAEYSAVLKNIYALSVGICKGQGYGDNFIAVLIANASYEIERFVNTTYPYERELNTSAYVGDLLVTSYSQFSRNRRFGMMIGQGYSIQSAKLELNDMVAEGYYATLCIKNINKKWNLEMPIADFAYSVLYEKMSTRNALKGLTKRLK